jgi:serine/threonine protein kinase
MAEMTFAENEVIGKWKIVRRLGAGGQATVWRVRYTDDSHSPAAALKLCTDPSEKARARFARELDLLREQNHPNIVRVRDAGDHKGLPYLVMELATTTLGHVALAESAGTRLILESHDLLLRFVRQACEAVAHLHDKSVLHRDIAPKNILLMLDPPEPMRAVLADLGIAAIQDNQGKLTATHETIGTPGFRAPESLNGQHTARSDVYSLGKTIEAVFNRGGSVEIGPGKCRRDQRLTDDLWDALDGVLARACAFDPGLRYDNAGALLQALPGVILGLDARSGPQIQAQRRPTISLTVAERVALSEVVAECPGIDDRTTLYHIRRRTRLNEYHFAISVRRLQDIAFIDSSVAQDEDGEGYPLLWPTAAGVKWAQEHYEEMNAAIAEMTPKSGYEEIPF